MARPADDLERFRAYLSMLARMRLGARYKGRVDESGVVQETLKDAYRALEEFGAWTEVQKLAWLKRILINNLIDAIRKTEAREVPLREDPDRSSVRCVEQLIAGGDSPSEHAKRNEQWRHLAEVLPELPEDQRTAVELHYLDGLPLADVAARMKRSKGAAAQLIHRGVLGLRARLGDREGGSR